MCIFIQDIHTQAHTYLCVLEFFAGKFSWDLDDGSPVLMPKPRLLAAAPSYPLLRDRSTFQKKKDETSGSVSDGVPTTRQSQLILLVLTGAHLLDSPELAGTRPSDPIIQAT